MPDVRPILIAGVGNELLSDDGVGVHAVRALQQAPIPGTRAVAIGTAVLDGLSFLEDADRVLLIDAARGGQPPGTVYRFPAPGTATREPAGSLHAMNLIDAARVLLPGRTVPPLCVIGVEPATLGYGLTLSEPVRTALPEVLRAVRETVADWLTASPGLQRAASAGAAAGKESADRQDQKRV
jgi:hydrogenase maturation protease